MTEPAALSDATGFIAEFEHTVPVVSRKRLRMIVELPIEYQKVFHERVGFGSLAGGPSYVALVPVTAETYRKFVQELQAPEARVDSSMSGKPSKPKGEHGDYAAKLYKSYFMRNEEVCKALGTVQQFKEWIQQQPSCLSGNSDWVTIGDSQDMVPRCEESHVERVFAGHGKAIKAPYHSVPLTHEEHKLRHGVNGGELACLKKFRLDENWVDVAYAKQFFESEAMQYRQKWAHKMLLEKLGYAHLADIPPSDIQKWAEEKGLTKYLPKSDLTE